MALAALSGLVILGETIGLRAIIAIGLIVLASSGASFKRKDPQSTEVQE